MTLTIEYVWKLAGAFLLGWFTNDLFHSLMYAWRADRTTFFIIVFPLAVAIIGYLLWFRWRNRLNHSKT